jgi:peptidoglycan/LPS O-acetylase OafA/YrhL
VRFPTKLVGILDGFGAGAMIAAVSFDLHSSGWAPRRLGVLWLLVVAACGVAPPFGFLATDHPPRPKETARPAPAAGAILAMLTNSLMPFSFERGGDLAGFSSKAQLTGSACRPAPR